MFGAVKLTANSDIDKCKYLGYGTAFDAKGLFLFPNGSFGQNIIIFGADVSSSVHANNRKNMLILGKGLTQGLDYTTLFYCE